MNEFFAVFFITLNCFALNNEALNQMRLNQELTDFTICSSIDNSIHHCHRLILALNSKDYWKQTLTWLKESNEGSIELPYSAPAIELVLKRIYLPNDNSDISPVPFKLYEEILGFVHMSKFENLEDIINVQIQFENDDILSVLKLAVYYDDENLAKQAFEYIQNNTDDEVKKYIIDKIKEGNKLIINSLNLIEDSKFFLGLSISSEAVEIYSYCRDFYVLYNINISEILRMDSWSKRQMKTALLQNNYKRILKYLIKYLEQSMLEQVELLEIKEPAQVLSFFLGYRAVNLTHFRDTILSTSRSTNLFTTIDNARAATGNAVSIAGDDIPDLVLFANSGIAKSELKKLLPIIELNEPENRDKISSKLAILFVFSYINNDIQYFLKAYHTAFKLLDNAPKLKTLSNEEIIKTIASKTWLKSTDLAKNKFIKSLKNIMTGIVDNIN